jgi:hypothetical protein
LEHAKFDEFVKAVELVKLARRHFLLVRAIT